MEKINGKIEFIKSSEEKVNKFGGKYKIYSIKLDSTLFFLSAFGNENSDPYCHYHKGDEVIIEYEKKGEFHNIKSIKEYNEEGEKAFENYLNNPIKQEFDSPVKEIISSEIFSNELNINGELYEITIKRK